MAAYAALVSLMNTMEHIKNHPRLSTSLDKKQTESLGQKLDFLLDFMEKYSHGGSKEAEDLVSQIASAAHAAEDVIESHIVDQIRAGSTEESPDFLLDLQKIIQDMDSIKEKVMKVKQERGSKDQQPTHSTFAASSRPLTAGNTTMVGFDSYLSQLLDWLIGQRPDRQIISIIGMAGIGKTTLARNVYEDLLIEQHFHVRGWVTISQNYNVREILLQTLSCIGESTGGMDQEDQLGEQLYQFLSGRKYLIILDDIWSIEAWNKIKFFFPENDNASRLIVTSRILDVAKHFGSLCLTVKLLNEDESWELFCQKAFAEESCPHLEKIGKQIVQKCKGLPLSIVVIGGLLRKSPWTQQHWADMEKDMSSIVNSAEDNQCLDILSLSYNYLPVCLKPCFLYFGIFPEDDMISVSQLIKLWVAEGFLRPNKDQSLEEVAKSYIKDLIDRNLILVYALGRTGNFKLCYVHDLVRDLCLRIAEKEKFFCVMRVLDTPSDIGRERRVIIHGSAKEYEECGAFHNLKSTSLVRSLICQRDLVSCEPRLLRVLKEVHNDSPDSIFEQVNLRFLGYQYTSSGEFHVLPSSISLLWNVQTLIIQTWTTFLAPSEIWEMPQLRHLKLNEIYLLDPRPSGKRDGIVLRNLQTLKQVVNFKWTKEACERIPNIKKLHVAYDGLSGEGETSLSNYCVYNIGGLNKLESLYYSFDLGDKPNQDDMLQNLKLPKSLKKLGLFNCRLHCNDLTVIGSLPHLEVLDLDRDSITGPEWNPIEGEFLRLKHLKMLNSGGLIRWNADKSHFPVLEELVINQVKILEEIPFGIGEIPTLQYIHLSHGSTSAAISAMKILEEQENLGNEGLRVKIDFWKSGEAEKFWENVEEEGVTCQNYIVRDFSVPADHPRRVSCGM